MKKNLMIFAGGLLTGAIAMRIYILKMVEEPLLQELDQLGVENDKARSIIENTVTRGYDEDLNSDDIHLLVDLFAALDSVKLGTTEDDWGHVLTKAKHRIGELSKKDMEVFVEKQTVSDIQTAVQDETFSHIEFETDPKTQKTYVNLIDGLHYGKMSLQDLIKHQEPDVYTEDDEEEVEFRDTSEGIMEVTYDEFMDYGSEFSYDSITLTYYLGDDILADERQEIIPNPLDIIGDIHNRLDDIDLSDGVEIRYVRNNILRLDIEVLIYADSYSRAVLGYESE